MRREEVSVVQCSAHYSTPESHTRLYLLSLWGPCIDTLQPRNRTLKRNCECSWDKLFNMNSIKYNIKNQKLLWGVFFDETTEFVGPRPAVNISMCAGSPGWQAEVCWAFRPGGSVLSGGARGRPSGLFGCLWSFCCCSPCRSVLEQGTHSRVWRWPLTFSNSFF